MIRALVEAFSGDNNVRIRLRRMKIKSFHDEERKVGRAYNQLYFDFRARRHLRVRESLLFNAWSKKASHTLSQNDKYVVTRQRRKVFFSSVSVYFFHDFYDDGCAEHAADYMEDGVFEHRGRTVCTSARRE